MMHLESPSEATVFFMFSQSLHHWQFGPDNSYSVGALEDSGHCRLFSSNLGLYPGGVSGTSPPLLPKMDR